MKKQIQRFGVGQTSKVIAILYLIGSAIVIIPMTAATLYATGQRNSLWWLLFPLLYALVGLMGTAIFCWLYNLSAKWVGGIEFNLIDIPKPPAEGDEEVNPLKPQQDTL